MTRRTPRQTRKPINLALQGGGAHGAFTWGVLDAMLEDERLKIEAISGTSAGAMNAVAFAAGYADGGSAGARASLRRFWEGVARASTGPSGGLAEWSRLFDPFGLADTLSRDWIATFVRNTSPYDLNPLNLNPLRDLVEELIDFEAVRACRQTKLFIAATRVDTGRAEIFHSPELTPDHVMASACLPFLFQAVEIDGRAYWDGGYAGNPPLYPFFYECVSRDILIVQINPSRREKTPRAVQEILDRVTEITFNASLEREYRAIEFVARLVEDGVLDGARYRKMLTHRIDGGEALKDLSVATRLTAELGLFEELFRRGRTAAIDWLEANFKHLGVLATLDLSAVLAEG